MTDKDTELETAFNPQEQTTIKQLGLQTCTCSMEISFLQFTT